MKKISQAAIEGLAMVSGQGRMEMYNARTDCACFYGCVALGYGISKDVLAEILTRDSLPLAGEQMAALLAADVALLEVGLDAMQLNDDEGMSVEDIAGIVRAEGH